MVSTIADYLADLSNCQHTIAHQSTIGLSSDLIIFCEDKFFIFEFVNIMGFFRIIDLVIWISMYMLATCFYSLINTLISLVALCFFCFRFRYWFCLSLLGFLMMRLAVFLYFNFIHFSYCHIFKKMLHYLFSLVSNFYFA